MRQELASKNQSVEQASGTSQWDDQQDPAGQASERSAKSVGRDAKQPSHSSREAAAFISPGRKPWVSAQEERSSVRTALADAHTNAETPHRQLALWQLEPNLRAAADLSGTSC